jgi:RNA polymerase sigma-70 factor (ECF subfamily)
MDAHPPDFDRHRPALLLWAKCQMPTWLRGKLDPADLVQQTLLEAHAAQVKLVGLTDLEVLAYARRALANNLIDAARKYDRTRSDVSPDEIAHSSVRLADWLAANHTSPSERAERNERFERLAVALSELPDAQRIAVEMRYLQKLKIAEIAQFMGRGENAVSQLLHRAVTALRDVLTDPDA